MELHTMNKIFTLDAFSMPSLIVETLWDSRNRILDIYMIMFTYDQRITFTVLISILIIIAIFANLATIYANIRRKNRPMYQACLLSLAVSDVLNVIFSGAHYLSQVSRRLSAEWILGELMCSMIPFIQTCAILASSFTLTGIALDRYWAIVRALRGQWEPGGLFSAASVVIVWGLAAGIASPMLSTYFTVDISVIDTDPNNHTVAVGISEATLCYGAKTDTSYYYIIIFTLIFLPLFCTFIWLYTTIAREIWKRRLPVAPRQPATSNNMSSTVVNDTATSDVSKRTSDTYYGNRGVSTISGNPGKGENGAHSRMKKEKNVRMERKVRTFKVILILMAVFFICKLPSWIFTLIKLNSKDDMASNLHWMLQYSFNVLTLISSCLNPFLYTFLNETIFYTEKIREFLSKVCCFCCICNKNQRDEQVITTEDHNQRASVCSNMVPRGPYAEQERKEKFYQKNIVQEQWKPKMESGVYIGTEKEENDEKII